MFPIMPFIEAIRHHLASTGMSPEEAGEFWDVDTLETEVWDVICCIYRTQAECLVIGAGFAGAIKPEGWRFNHGMGPVKYPWFQPDAAWCRKAAAIIHAHPTGRIPNRPEVGTFGSPQLEVA